MTRADATLVPAHVPLLDRVTPTPRDVQVAAMAVLIRHKATDLREMLFAPLLEGRRCHVCDRPIPPEHRRSRCMRCYHDERSGTGGLK